MTKQREHTARRRVGIGRVISYAVAVAVVAALVPGSAASADHTGDDVRCPATHCVNGADLAHGDLNNLAEDAGFERTPASALPASPSWAASGSPQLQVVNGGSTSLGPNCYTGVRCATRQGTGSATSAALDNAAMVEARQGDTFIAEGWLRGDSAATGTAGVHLTWYGAAPPGVRASVLRVDQIALAPSTGYKLVRVRGTAPAGAAAVAAGFVVVNQTAGVWWADAMRFERLVDLADQNYSFGFGLIGGSNPITGNTVSVNPATVQERVRNTCPAGTAIVGIAQDGTATCRAGDGAAYYAYRNTEHKVCDSLCYEANFGPLPAGTWALFAKEQFGLGDQARLHCKLVLGGDSDDIAIQAKVSIPDGFNDVTPTMVLTTPASLQLVATISSPANAYLACGLDQGSATASTIKITAIPLGGQNRTALG